MLGCTEKEFQCAHMLLEISLYDNRMVYVAPSLLALAALCLSCKMIDVTFKKPQNHRLLFFKDSQLNECWNGEVDKAKLQSYMKDICDILDNVNSNADQYSSVVKRIKKIRLDDLLLIKLSPL